MGSSVFQSGIGMNRFLINSKIGVMSKAFEVLPSTNFPFPHRQSNEFLNAVAQEEVSLELVQHTVGKLENVAIYLLSAYFPADGLEASAASDLNLLRCLEVPAARDLTPFPSSRPKDHLIRFGHCQFQFASFLANLSVLPEAVATLSQPCR